MLQRLLRADRRLLMAVVIVLSLGLHVGILYWFSGIPIGPFAIPAQARQLPQPLRLKRVEIPARSLADQEPPAPVVPPPPPPAPGEPPPVRLPEAAQSLPESLQAAPPPVLPDTQPGAAPAFAPIVPAPPASVSPYTLNDRAPLEAELSKFAVAPHTPGLPAEMPSAPAPPGSPGTPGDQPAGQEGTGTAPSAGALPSLDEVSARFRLAPPTLNPALPQPVVLTLPTDILFDFDSAALRPGADALLKQALAYFRRYKKADIEIDGHTDSFGTADYNQKLSEDRANAVAAWFRPSLPEGDYTVATHGFGATRPVVDPHGTVAAQQKNRRVEIVLRALAPQG